MVFEGSKQNSNVRRFFYEENRGFSGFFFAIVVVESGILSLCTNAPISLPSSRCQSPPALELKFAQGASRPLCQTFRIEKEKAFIIHSMRLHTQTRYHLSAAQTRVPFQKIIFSRLQKVSNFMER